MLRNYFLVGIRHLYRNKFESILNIGGLAIGATIAILVGLWVNDEVTFNHYHKNHDNIAQVYKGNGQKWLPLPLATELKEKYSQLFSRIAVVLPSNEYALTAPEKTLRMTGQFVEPSLPEMLALRLTEGSIKAFYDPHAVLLSASTAKALFRNNAAVDQHLRIDNNIDVTVAGVFEDMPGSSEFSNIEFFMPWALNLATRPEVATYVWDNHFIFIYTEKLPGLTFEEVAPRIENAADIIHKLDYMKEAGANQKVWLMPMNDWHLHSEFDWKNQSFSNGPSQFVLLVGVIGLFVLLLACINFMNLATARSEKRTREVGIRKAIGSHRSQLIGQFFSESFIMVMIALVLAIVLTYTSLPLFNSIASKTLVMPWTSYQFWMSCAGLVLLVGLIAGSYPALYLSSFRPSIVLKGRVTTGRGTSMFRRSLVGFQFTISIMLIISTIVVYQQIMFAKNREAGYNRGGLLITPGRAYTSKIETLREQLLATGVVVDVAPAGQSITTGWSQGGGFTWEGKTPGDDPTFGTIDITPSFGNTVGWKMIAGRDFDEEITSDSSAFVINEAAAKVMGFADPIGQVVHWKSKWHGKVDKDFHIVGVASNLVMRSPFDHATPSIFFLGKFYNAIHIRIADNVSPSEAVAKIENVYKTVAPEWPFEYQFADDEFNRKFANEERIGNLAAVFSVLAIFISCLGLFGMASFMAERRTKEIGIRKVVGASVFRLWKMMSTEFLVIVVISFAIAAPLSWFTLNRWMETFAYRTNISWTMIAATGVICVGITLFTISWTLLQAATRNPVDSLRSE